MKTEQPINEVISLLESKGHTVKHAAPVAGSEAWDVDGSIVTTTGLRCIARMGIKAALGL